jgi:hypothetical protein
MVCVCILCRLKEVGQIVLETLNEVRMLEEEDEMNLELECMEKKKAQAPSDDEMLPGACIAAEALPDEEQVEEVVMALQEVEMALEEEPELDQPGRLVEQMWPVGQRGLRSPNVAAKKRPLTRLLPRHNCNTVSSSSSSHGADTGRMQVSSSSSSHGADTGRMQLSSSSSSHGADTGRTQLIGGGTGWRHHMMRPPPTPPSAKLLASYGLQLKKHRKE